MSSFKSSENIQKKEGGPDRSVSDNQSSPVTLNKLTMKARKSDSNFNFYKVKLRFTVVYIISALKHILWVQVRTASMIKIL